MSAIYLMRHGETVWNRQKRLQGRKDSPLTSKGVDQARAFGATLRELRLSPADCDIVASPLGRAWATAVLAVEAWGGDPAAIRHDDRLMEHAFGQWEGLLWADVERDHAESLAARMADKWNVRAPDGESYADLAARVASFLASCPSDRPTVAVCHGVTARVMRGLYGRLSKEETMSLPEPQDRIFELRNREIRECEAVSG